MLKPIAANNIGEVKKPTSTNTQASTLTPMPAIFRPFTAIIVPIKATIAASGTNTMPKNRIPSTARTQAIIPATNRCYEIEY
ncbi:hypothetical protein HMPREF9080_00146 [Cardiobacterium valvarum F0432]|uniref:Uncharacterized protein n=1 Tax=Cardiobacterium valvarum F0432 TaxID=797473 RepID=G9ZBM2_9GAMM|nr:hypothetical protein HMPREF9080_00146 [Cardiobacterium valvarum F0432]